MKRNMLCALCGALGGLVAAMPVQAQEQTPCEEQGMVKSGTITADLTSVAFIAGIRWGKGTLTLNSGESHNFSFQGLKLIETGATARKIEGDVYNLTDLKDFIGVYYGGSAAATVGVGKGEVLANNSKCVVIKAKASGEGLQLSPPGPGGVYVQFSE